MHIDVNPLPILRHGHPIILRRLTTVEEARIPADQGLR
jgi:hypothetical protein